MKHKLKICHIVSGDLWAGAEVQVFNILSGLKNFEQIEIHAIVMNSGRLYRELVSLGISVQLIDEKKQSIFSQFRQMLMYIKSNRIDIIHSHRYKENIFSTIIVLLLNKNIKLLKTQHGSFNIVSTIRLKIYRAIDLVFTKLFFDKVISVSHDIENEFIDFIPPNKVQTIHNSINPERFLVPLSANDYINQINNSIGIIGRLEKIKNIDEFIKIAIKIKKRILNLHAFIAGEGSEKPHLKSLVKEMGAEDFITFLGHVDDVSTFYKKIDILFVTSIHEGIPTVILEAMYFNKIIIAHDVGGISEVIDHKINGFLYKNFNFAAHLATDIMINKDAYSIISNNARMKVDNIFSNNIQASKYLNQYFSIS